MRAQGSNTCPLRTLEVKEEEKNDFTLSLNPYLAIIDLKIVCGTV